MGVSTARMALLPCVSWTRAKGGGGGYRALRVAGGGAGGLGIVPRRGGVPSYAGGAGRGGGVQGSAVEEWGDARSFGWGAGTGAV